MTQRFNRYLLSCLCLLLPTLAAATSISAYTPVNRPVLAKDGTLQLALRTFQRAGVQQALLVNPQTLATAVVPASDLTPAPITGLAATPYARALAATTAGPVSRQNHGLRHALQPVSGQFLTVDLCPSRRPFEQAFFTAVAASGQPQPVPVAVAITGAWLANHAAEFAWLREQEQSGRLALTWVNHSLTHPYDAAAPLARTFLLTPGLDQRQEVLALEVALLEQGVVPSVFFRFPGLVADAGLIVLVRDLGLIPLGSDAWLAKGEKPRSGSIILVHGNGNEPAGITRFTELQRQRTLATLLPLPAAITGLPGGN